MGTQQSLVAGGACHHNLDGTLSRVGIAPIRAKLDDFVVKMDADVAAHGDHHRLAGLRLAALLVVRHQVGSDHSHPRFGANNLLQHRPAALQPSLLACQNRAVETAQVIEELIEMAKKFHAAANRAEELGLTEDDIRFYDALANNESAVRELNDETLKKIAHELTENLRKNITVDWSARESIRAKLRIMVKRILKKYKYPPDQQEVAVELVLQQAEALGEAWV